MAEIGHIILVQWISGEILPHFDIKHISVAKKLAELEHFKGNLSKLLHKSMSTLNLAIRNVSGLHPRSENISSVRKCNH